MSCSQLDREDGGRTISDAVHGHLRFSQKLLHFIDTPQFQRLRALSQLGTTHFVFPSCVHTRFSHSLGTAYLAEQMIDSIKRVMGSAFYVSDEDAFCVQVAGLCHDLGHGPFSHCFETFMRRKAGDYHHEAMSLAMFEYLCTDNGLYDGGVITQAQAAFVKRLISGAPDRAEDEGRLWTFDVVANARNSVDVDKLDYLARDCLAIGQYTSVQFGRPVRLLANCRVIDDEICFHEKVSIDIWHMFYVRYNMHRQVYTHKTAVAIQEMINDAYELADATLRISERARTAPGLLALNDALLDQIEFLSPEHEQVEEMRAARDIIRRLRTRDLYKLVGSVLISEEGWAEVAHTTAADITAYSPFLHPHDVCVVKHKFDFPKSELSLLEQIHFYDSKNPNKKFKLNEQSLTLMGPERLTEHQIRLFVKSEDKFVAASAAWEEWQKYMGPSTLISPIHPFRSPRKRKKPNTLEATAKPAKVQKTKE